MALSPPEVCNQPGLIAIKLPEQVIERNKQSDAQKTKTNV
jgi:hypothetical protein